MSDPLIIGGGPAGAAAAITLARAGRSVTLIERHAEPHDKVCGDFLSGEAIAMLESFGVDLSMAAPITTVRLIHGNRVAAAPLPFPALGLTRRTLDEALLRQAQANGTNVVRGHRVSAIGEDHRQLRLNCSSLGDVVADTVFLATGKHELGGAQRTARGEGLVGLKMYYALHPTQREALRGHVELVLFDGGYSGMQLVEDDRAVFCVLASGVWLRALGGRWDGLLDALVGSCPHLRNRLAGAEALLERALAIGGLPYGYVHKPAPRDPSGLFRLGDQAAVIGSLTGDGVALALASGRLGVRCWLEGGSSADYHRRLAASIAHQMRLASLVHSLCLRPVTQPWLAALCSFWPRLLGLTASATRATRLTHTGYAG